jgi:spermidine/putrescine transport system ATP-binding protein
VNRPKVLLLDEPLAALDRKLRRDMQIELQNLQREVGITFVLVTHDQEEALSMSDSVLVMREGRIVQRGAPAELYDEPRTRYVADFVGKTNFFDGTALGPGSVRLADGQPSAGRVPRGARTPRTGEAVSLAIRPELVTLAAGAGADAREVRVRNRIFLGENTEYLVESPALGPFLVLVPKRLETGGLAPGAAAFASWPPDAALILVDD